MKRRNLSRAALALGVLLTIVGACSSEPDPQAVKADATRRGDQLLKDQQFRDAAAAYRRAINVDPKDADLRLKLADALRGAEMWQELARQSVVAADLLPGNEAVQRRAVEGMLITGRFEDALERVRPLHSNKPNDLELLLLHGHARARMLNDWWALQVIDEQFRKGIDFQGARLKVRTSTIATEDAEAEGYYRAAYALASEQLEPALALGGFLLTKGRTDEALTILEKAAVARPDHALLTRTLGLYFAQAGQDAPAEKYLTLAASKGNRIGQLVLADFYVRTKRIDEALTIVATIPASDPDAISNLRAAEIQFHAGKKDLALERAEQVLAKQPNLARALQLKSRVLLANGDGTQALSLARKAVASDAVSRDARLALAEALAATGKMSEAFEQYSEAWRGNMRDPAVAKALARVALALGRFGIAEDLAGQSLRLKPGDTEAAVIVARSHIHLGEFSKADRALAPFAGKGASAEILALEGEILAARGNAAAARAAFINALQIDRDSIDALRGLLELDIKAGQAARLRPQVDQAVSRHPKDPDYLFLSAQVAAAEKNFQRAEQTLRTILESDGAREDAVVLLASLLGDQGRLKEAQAVAEKSLERLQASSRIRMKLGEILEMQAQPSAAQAQYEKVISDNQLAGATTDMVDAFNTASARLAALFANQRIKLDQALQLASAAKRHRPNDPFFSDTLGWVHVRKDRARMGLPYLEAAVSSDPGNPVFRYHLGVAYEQLADFAKARNELTRALEMNPRFMGAEDARTLLKAIGK